MNSFSIGSDLGAGGGEWKTTRLPPKLQQEGMGFRGDETAHWAARTELKVRQEHPPEENTITYRGVSSLITHSRQGN